MDYKKENVGDVLIITPMPSEKNSDEGLGTMKNEIASQHVAGFERVVIDLQNINYINSGDIGVIIGCVRYFFSRKGMLLIASMRPKVAETMFIINMHKAIPFRIDKSDAVSELNKTVKSHDASTRLLARNPSLSEIHAYWNSQKQIQDGMIAKANDVHPVDSRQFKIPDDKKEHEPNHKKFFHQSDENTAQNLMNSGWESALEIVQKAKMLYNIHGLVFKPEITFKEFLAKMSEKMNTKG